jgi:hypothetical protein
LKGWVFSVGEGSYKESDYEPLYTEVVDESDNRYYESSTNTVVDVEEGQSTTLYEEDIPDD